MNKYQDPYQVDSESQGILDSSKRGKQKYCTATNTSVEKKKQSYMKKMKEAAQDKGFIDRTMSSQKDFDAIEIEVVE